VTPPEEVVRRDESEVKDEPRPLNEDEEVLDPAVAVVWDPVGWLLEVASAMHGAIGAAAALPGDEAAAMASETMVAATSVRRAPFSQGNIREDSFRLFHRGLVCDLTTMPLTRLQLKKSSAAEAALSSLLRGCIARGCSASRSAPPAGRHEECLCNLLAQTGRGCHQREASEYLGRRNEALLGLSAMHALEQVPADGAPDIRRGRGQVGVETRAVVARARCQQHRANRVVQRIAQVRESPRNLAPRQIDVPRDLVDAEITPDVQVEERIVVPVES
jgi:hypothetical protein